MQVVGTEHGIATTLDPLFGSVKLAAIEDQVRTQVDEVLEAIRAKGGALACIASGVVARLIDEGRERRDHQLRAGARTWVGVNEYAAPQHRPLFAGASTRVPTLAQVEHELIEQVRSHKRATGARVAAPLDEVRRVAASHENLLPATVAALHAGATGEQIVSATRAGFRGR
jgi:methylmalonyl-CoA mutase, N-terminal domain